MTAFNSAVALAVARLTQRLWNGLMLSGGLAVTLLPMFWLSRLSPGTSYLTGIELPMVLIGMGQAATPSHHLRPTASPVSAVTTHVPLQPLVKAPKHVREPGGAAVLLLASSAARDVFDSAPAAAADRESRVFMNAGLALPRPAKFESTSLPAAAAGLALRGEQGSAIPGPLATQISSLHATSKHQPSESNSLDRAGETIATIENQKSRAPPAQRRSPRCRS